VGKIRDGSSVAVLLAAAGAQLSDPAIFVEASVYSGPVMLRSP